MTNERLAYKGGQIRVIYKNVGHLEKIMLNEIRQLKCYIVHLI